MVGPDVIQIDYYTDPFSCWSWCNEPRLRRLQLEFGSQLVWRFVMGGLLEPAVSPVEQPALFAELAEDWQALRQEQGMPINPALWQSTEPPISTRLACYAVKVVGHSQPRMVEPYLRRLREAAMTEANPLDTKEKLLALAKEVAGLDTARMKKDWEAPAALEALNADFAETRRPLFQAEEVKVTSDGQSRYAFPTMVLRYAEEIRVLSPFPPYEKYVRMLMELKPDIERYPVPPLETLLRLYQRLTTKEIEVLCQWSHAQAMEQLESLREERRVEKIPVGGDFFWASPTLVTA